jgi:hypothetical protein
MDRGIWATWYDLPADGEAAFLDWLHGTHLPALQARPGYLWAASYRVVGESLAAREAIYDPARDGPGLERGDEIGTGTRFIQLVGASEPSAFFNPAIHEIPETQAPENKAMLDKRRGVRAVIYLEEARVNGPEIHTRPVATAPAPAIQLGAFRAKNIGTDFDIGAWYYQDRLTVMAAVPGCVGIRKLISVAGWAKHSPLYEFVSLDARANFAKNPPPVRSEAFLKRHKSVQAQSYHTYGSPAIAERMWPAV